MTMSGRFTVEEVAEHNTRDSLWIIIDDDVIDITDYAAVHPGGPEEILPFAVGSFTGRVE